MIKPPYICTIQTSRNITILKLNFSPTIMKTITAHLHLLLLMLFPICGCTIHENASSELATKNLNTSTVKSLDVTRYMGKWYEIARFDHRFERGMDNVMTTYKLRPDGKIEVVNEGYKNGKHHIARGKAFVPNVKEHPGQLRVSFFLWFYSDYYILELDETNYTYAVIGSSSDKYLWILYRHPVIPEDLLNDLLQRINKRGYNTSLLYFVKQDKY